MLKCKHSYCRYPNCDGENCGVPVENLLALMCADANYWRQTVQQMYNTAMAVPVGKVERELRRFLPEDYVPACPFGYPDCVSDPAYIREFYPEWWIELGRPTCCDCYTQQEADNMGNCPYYDDEDK